MDSVGRRFVLFDHEEALSVWSDVVVGGSGARRSARGTHAVGVASLPQHTWLRSREVPMSADSHSHQVVAVAVVEFAAFASPDWVRTPLSRNLDLWAGPWIGLDIDLVSAGLIRSICDPPPVRRELRRALGKFRLSKGARLALVDGKDPDVGASFEADLGECNNPAVRRASFAPNAERQPLAIRRPEGPVADSVQREPG